MKKTMHSIAIITAFCTIIFTILYQTYQQDMWLTLAITFGTTCYHFVMRLVIGLVVNKLEKHPFPYNNRWFSSKSFEKKLYSKLKVKSWKSKMPTYNPDSFSLEKHTLEEIIQNMCISEMVHEVIIVFSFLPLFMAIPFGVFPVFLITSICAASIDAMFVIMQRYNRPRLVKIMKKAAKK